MDCYSSALCMNPTMVEIYNNMGDLWRVQGPAGQSGARNMYMEALRLQKTFAPAWRGLGESYREMGEHSTALGFYQEALRLRAGYEDAFTGMGLCLKELGRREEAEQCFKEVVRLRPCCALSLGNLAGAGGVDGKCTGVKAVMCCCVWKTHCPPTGLYYEQGKLEEAIATYKQALAIEPVFPEAYNNLGNTLREAGRHEEAVGYYIMCIQQQLQQQTAQGVGGQRLPPQQAQRLSVAYNNLGGILKIQVRTWWVGGGYAMVGGSGVPCISGAT